MLNNICVAETQTTLIALSFIIFVGIFLFSPQNFLGLWDMPWFLYTDNTDGTEKPLKSALFRVSREFRVRKMVYHGDSQWPNFFRLYYMENRFVPKCQMSQLVWFPHTLLSQPFKQISLNFSSAIHQTKSGYKALGDFWNLRGL